MATGATAAGPWVPSEDASGHARWTRIETWIVRRIGGSRTRKRTCAGVLVGVVLGAGLVAWLALLRVLVGDAGNRLLTLTLVVVSVTVAVALVRATQFSEYWVPWRRHKRIFSDVYGPVMLAFAALTVAAVCLEVALTVADLSNVDWTAADAQKPARSADPGVNLVPVSFEYFIWSFFDGIPVLKLTDALNWKPARTFTDHWSGSLLVLYKLAVIVPIVTLVVRSLKAPEEPAPAATAEA